jgi:hypothetical protein
MGFEEKAVILDLSKVYCSLDLNFDVGSIGEVNG